MKEIKLSVDCDLSESSVEQAIIDIRNDIKKDVFSLILNVSVFDVSAAVSMMIDDRFFLPVRYVHITPEFRSGEWSIVDDLNEVYIESHT